MKLHIDYFMTPISPWVYLGHARLMTIASRYDATIAIKPCDFGTIFAESGGLPLAKRAPQRRAYRLMELARFRDYLALPLNLEPKHFPVSPDLAARVIITAARSLSSLEAMRLAGAFGRAAWALEQDISNGATLVALANDLGLDGDALLRDSADPSVQALYDQNTQDALSKGAFGAPTYCVGGDMFWGQDRLEFLERRLASERHV